MMRKVFLFVIAILEAVVLQAGVVPVDEALQQARDFISSRRSGDVGSHLQLAHRRAALQNSDKGDAADFYVFNNGTDDGFVIVSADDRTQPILGYSDSGTFDEQQLPENLRYWLDDYAEQIRQLDFLGISHRLPVVAMAANRRNIVAMIPCKWGQKAPFNQQCPEDPETQETCLAGCGAVAMAQAMYYYKYPSRTTTTIPAYTSKTRKIDMPAISQTAIDWAKIVPIYNNDKVTTTQEAAVASLIKLCGSALEMDYSSTSSGSSMSGIAYALIKYFGYDAGLRLLRHNTIGINQWDEAIYGELAAGRPVLYRGKRDRTGADSGHIFVIDGYDGSGYYHLNWGWNGNWNGYFLLNVLSPYVSTQDEQLLSNEGYCMGHYAITGIQPDAGGTAPPLCMTAESLELNQTATTLQRSSTSVDFPEVQLSCNTYNLTGETNSFDVGVGLLNASGQLIASAFNTTAELDANWGWKSLPAKITFGKGLANGVYRLVNISRESGKNLPWQISEDGEYYCVYATVNGKTLTLRNRSLQLSGNLFADGTLEAGKLNALTAYIQNDGTDFLGDVYLFVDGKRAGGRFVDIAEGGAMNMPIGFTPDKEGKHQLRLAYYDNQRGDTCFFATKDFQVNPAAFNSLKLSLVSTNAKNKIIGTTYQLNVKAENTNSSVYDNKLRAIIYKLRHDGSTTGDRVGQLDHSLKLDPGKSETVSFEFKDLEDGETYFVWIYYFSKGATDRDNRLYGNKVTVNVAVGISSLQADDGTTVIYNTKGMGLLKCPRSQIAAHLRNLSKGVYIIDGKKFINK